MIDKQSPIALILRDQKEISLFTQVWSELGYRKITAFTDTREAYEVMVRQLFPIIVVRMEMNDMNGLVLIQKLRETGNYGEEHTLFVCDKLDSSITNILYEFDIEYVCVSPKTKNIASQKIKHLLDSENNLSEFDIQYRTARSAYFNNILDMAEEIAQKLLLKDPKTDRIAILLGDIALKRQDNVSMFKWYNQAMKENPNSPAIAQKLAQAHMHKGEYERAAQLLDTVAQVNPYHLKTLECAGLSHLELNHIDEAEAYANQLSAIDESNKSATEIQSQSQIKQGHFSDITSNLKKTHSDKEIISYLNTAGVKLAKNEDVQGAIQIYKTVIKDLGKSKYLYAVYYNLALAYIKQGKTLDAEVALNKSLEINPDFEKSKTTLAKIRKTA